VTEPLPDPLPGDPRVSRKLRWLDSLSVVILKMRSVTRGRLLLRPIDALLLLADRNILLHLLLRALRHRNRNQSASISLPDDECIQWPCFWLVEAFTPSQFHDLPRLMKKAGWLNRVGRQSSQEVAEWLADFRETSDRQGWRQIASIVRKREYFQDFDSIEQRLPEAFREVSISAVAYSPSITFIVARFDLDPSLQFRLDEVLRTDATARIVREAGVRTVQLAEGRKRSEVNAARAYIHQQGSTWLAARAPGVFATERDRRHQCLDLLLTKSVDPASPSSEAGRYLMALDLHATRLAWRSTDYPGLTLHPRQRTIWNRANRGDFALAGRKDLIVPDDHSRRFDSETYSCRNRWPTRRERRALNGSWYGLINSLVREGGCHGKRARLGSAYTWSPQCSIQ
jgi:hypothetical protein